MENKYNIIINGREMKKKEEERNAQNETITEKDERNI